MKYQPRYVAYLALIGNKELATNLYYIEFIGIMVELYRSFRGVSSDVPIIDHKEFTAFIQQTVSHHK